MGFDENGPVSNAWVARAVEWGVTKVSDIPPPLAWTRTTDKDGPIMDLLAADADMVRTLVKALWSGGCEGDAELARTLVAQVLTPLVQEPATSIKGALRKQPSRSSRAAAKAKASAVLVSA